MFCVNSGGLVISVWFRSLRSCLCLIRFCVVLVRIVGILVGRDNVSIFVCVSEFLIVVIFCGLV